MSRYSLTCGTVETPLKVAIYGHEGIGKTTLAAKFPNTLFIDIENGSKQLPVARMPRPTSLTMLMDEIFEIKRNAKDYGCSTLVIDTMDAAEQLCIASVLAEKGISGMEELDYGKAYTFVNEKFGRMLDALSEVVESGTNVVLLGHTTLSKFERPDETSAYDRWSLKLIDSKKASNAALVKAWADMVFFADYKITVIKDAKTKKAKGTGGERVLRTEHSATWDAKNRFGLPETMPLNDATAETIAGLMTDRVAQWAKQAPVSAPEPSRAPAPAPAPATPPKPTASVSEARSRADETVDRLAAQVEQLKMDAPAGKPPARPDYPERMGALADLMERDGVTDAELRKAVAETGNFPENTPATQYEQGFVDYLVAGWAKILDRVKVNRTVPF
jgi:hypothetical protein